MLPELWHWPADPIVYLLQPRTLQTSFKSQVFTRYPAVYASTIHARWLVSGLMIAVSLGFDQIATADNYQRLVWIVFVAMIIIDTFPVLHFGATPVNEERGMATPSTSSWSQDHLHPARACYWHATITHVCSTLDSNPHTTRNYAVTPRMPTGIAVRPASEY